MANDFYFFRAKEKQIMKIWLIKDGEYLPIQPNVRKMRMWMLADSLLEREHSIIWWASTFSHQRKSLLYQNNVEISLKDRFRLKLLYAGKYQNNISFRRFLHHRRLAIKFRAHAYSLPTPDVIVCAFPIIDVAYEVIGYAKIQDIPVIIDIRDPWPDTLIDKCPKSLQKIVKALLMPAYLQTKAIMRNADSLVAISNGLLEWGLGFAQRLRRSVDNCFYIGYQEQTNGINEYSDRIQKFKSTIKKKTVFTFIGIFGSSYELQLICDVAERLINGGHKNVHFALAGDGDQYKSISLRAKSLPNVTLLGWLDKNEILHLLEMSHVGLVPCRSINDAAPNKVFEYFSAGIPVISSLKGEMERFIAKNQVGYSYSCGDAETLCTHVIQLYENSSLKQMMSTNVVKLFQNELRADVIYHAYSDHVERVAGIKKDKHLQK